MICLADSSLLIEGLKEHGRPRAVQRARELIAANALAYWDMVAGEVLIGARTEREADDILYYLGSLHELPAPPRVWQRAATLGRELRRKGLTMALTDLSVAVVAMHHGVPLVHMDRDYIEIAQVCDLQQEYVEPDDE